MAHTSFSFPLVLDFICSLFVSSRLNARHIASRWTGEKLRRGKCLGVFLAATVSDDTGDWDKTVSILGSCFACLPGGFRSGYAKSLTSTLFSRSARAR